MFRCVRFVLFDGPFPSCTKSRAEKVPVGAFLIFSVICVGEELAVSVFLLFFIFGGIDALKGNALC